MIPRRGILARTQPRGVRSFFRVCQEGPPSDAGAAVASGVAVCRLELISLPPLNSHCRVTGSHLTLPTFYLNPIPISISAMILKPKSKISHLKSLYSFMLTTLYFIRRVWHEKIGLYRARKCWQILINSFGGAHLVNLSNQADLEKAARSDR